MKTPRRLCVDLLYKLENQEDFSNELLNKAFREHAYTRQEQRFATRLFYGVLENRLLIDHFIGKVSSTRMKKIHGIVLNALRIGIYQILFMDQVPDSAAVNESVKISKKVNKRAGGFANGILRSFIRKLEEGEMGLPGAGTPDAASLRYSMPRWITGRLESQYDPDTVIALLRENNQAPPVCLRTNTLKIERERLRIRLLEEGIETAASSHTADGLLVLSFGLKGLTETESFMNGLFYIQDEASMMVSEKMAPLPGDLVLDLCAAPGGKATHLAQLMSDRGSILAFDLYPHRVETILDNARRLGIASIEASTRDSRLLGSALGQTADRILLDVPCSGMGIFRRKPELKYRLKEGGLRDLLSLQRALLESADACLKPGGVLVYSTCTLDHSENDGQILDFLKRHPSYSLVDINGGRYPALYKNGIGILEEAVHTYPHRDKTDGFFICKLKKTSTAGDS